MSALLAYLVPSPTHRSGFANVHLVPVRKGRPVTFGSEVEWKNKFTPEQLATAPLSLVPILQSNSVAILPGYSESLSAGLRSRGFASARYDLTEEEYRWILSVLPADKAEKWRQANSKTVTMVVCAGRVNVSSGSQDKYCEAPPGLKLEEVAPVKSGGIVSDIGAALGNGIKAAFDWVVPDAIQNASIFSASTEPSQDQRRQAEKFVAEYDRMAASVADVERLKSKGAPIPRDAEVRLQMSRILLAEYAQPVAEFRKSMGEAAKPSVSGSMGRRGHGRTRRNRSRDTYGIAPAVIVVVALVCLTVGACTYLLSDAFSTFSTETTRQVESNVKYRQDLLAKCGDPSMPAEVRDEACKGHREESKRPLAGTGEGTDWGRVAMWGGISILAIGGAFAISSIASTAKPVVLAASDRMRERSNRSARQQQEQEQRQQQSQQQRQQDRQRRRRQQQVLLGD